MDSASLSSPSSAFQNWKIWKLELRVDDGRRQSKNKMAWVTVLWTSKELRRYLESPNLDSG